MCSFPSLSLTTVPKLQRLHGSGTAIGDALELEGVKTSLAKIGYSRKDCLVGSNKGTLGNTQHASGLVSLIKICKSIQTGIIPAMARTGKLNSIITDANLALNFAYQPTKVEPDALIGISAAGWGGVNSHVVVQVPPAKLIKKMGNRQSKYSLCNETLAAPRKSGLEGIAISLPNGVDPALDLLIPEVNNIVGNGHVVVANGIDPALDLVIQEVNKVLDDGHLIDAETDLRAAGFDSARFVRLSHGIKRSGKGFHLP